MALGCRSTDWQKLTFAIAGLGLMGASYAKALRRLQVKRIIGVEKDPATLGMARALALIDLVREAGGEELREADVVICAIYPEAIVPFLQDNAHFLAPGVLVTDVAGIKGTLPEDAQALLGERGEFISGHPMAGRQGSGLAMSDAEIFLGAYFIIVPEERSSEAAAQWLEQFALALGCRRTVRVSPREHDGIIAYTSNLPHVTAVALMDSASFNEKTKYFVAGSFRDGTRVADINPELWSILFLANRQRVAEEITRYMEQLKLWRQALLEGDGETLKRLMARAAARRKELY